MSATWTPRETASLEEPHELGSAATDPGPPRERPSASPGDCVGRYTVRARIGAGGMGEVFAADDPNLERVVALKMLRRGLADPSPEARARFQREAQAMARLNHPNVVAVYDVGVFEDQVFVAMELVDGPTLEAWLLEKPRPWRDVLDALLQAGRGLAAAHAAGIVHRDFKPSNVIVGDRVRVADFGLARGRGDRDSEPGPATATLDASVTRTGDRIGTPAYMAPEQVARATATAASDQYAYCLTFWEALHGERPPPDPPPPRDRAAPRWVTRALARGLALRPEDRWPSMHALLSSLDRHRSLGARLVGGGAALTAVAALAFVLGRQRIEAEPCAGAAALMAGVWDDTRREAVRAAFAGSGLPYAAASFGAASARVDAYARAWIAMETDACRATRVEQRHSERVLDLRMACLERARSLLASVTDLWIHDPGKTAVESAVEAADALPPLAECADTRGLLARAPPPDDPAVAAEIAAARRDIDAVRALALARRHAEARKLTDAMSARAEATGWPQVQAEAAWTEGAVRGFLGESGAEAVLHRAARLANEAGDDRLAATALTRLVVNLAEVHSSPQRALLVADLAEGHVVRAGDDTELRVELLWSRGIALRLAGRYPEATAVLAAGWARAANALGPQHTLTLRLVVSLANVAGSLGDNVRARRLLEENLRESEIVLGPDHPRIAVILNLLAIARSQQGELDAAADLYRRAIVLRERDYGADADPTLSLVNNLGVNEIRAAHYDEALALLERVRSARERRLGPDHPRVAMVLDNIGAIHTALGRYREALELHERALAVLDRPRDTPDPEVAETLANLGRARLGLGEPLRALEDFRRGLDIRSRTGGAAHPATRLAQVHVAEALAALGRCAEARPLLARSGTEDDAFRRGLVVGARCDLAEGQPAAAQAGLERALAMAEGTERDRVELGRMRFLLARALWAVHRHGDAVATARRAEDELAAHAGGASDRRAVRTWMARR